MNDWLKGNPDFILILTQKSPHQSIDAGFFVLKLK